MHLNALVSSPWLRPLAKVRDLETRAARGLVERLLRDVPAKRFAVRLWDGTEVGWGAERDFTLVFHDVATFASLVGSGDPAAFADAYVAGRLDIEGDIDAATGLASHLSSLAPDPLGALVHVVPGARPPGRHRRPANDTRDVQAHYDLSDDFFRLFLDARMVYSCAYFAHEKQPLEEAQERKLDLVCRKLDLHPGDRFLDVGCGWGALVLWAAGKYGVRAHGITLSENQAEAARERATRAGLAGRVTIELRHYEDLPAGAFDKIASVGMIEHVGTARYPKYFATLRRALRPGGLLLNHGITKPPSIPRRTGGDFVLGRVFPGAEIGVLSGTLTAMEEEDLEVVDVQSLRPHYALTLAAWTRRYRAGRAEAARLVPEHVVRAWDLYLPGCRRAFQDGIVSVHQSLAAKGRRGRRTWSLPLTREALLLGPAREDRA